MENKINDLDLDIISFCKKLDDDESVVYIRSQGTDVFVSYYGDTHQLVNSIVGALNNNGDLYDILSASVYLFEEDSIQVTEEEGEVLVDNVFSQYNLVVSSIVTMFAEKHGVKFNGWAEFGVKSIFGEDIINFGDIMYDLESEQPEGNFFKWYDSDNDDYVAWCDRNER